MADVLKRLYGPALLPAVATTIYTVPAGVTTVVRNIHVAAGPNTATFNLAVNSAASALTTCLYFQFVVPASGVFDWSGVLVLAPNDYLSAMASNALYLPMVISGLESS